MSERPGLWPRDLLAEAAAGVLQRPGRAALTSLGTVLGVAALLAVLGLTTTVAGQISRRFNALVATEVTVDDTGGAEADLAPVSFPDNADAVVSGLNGVRHAGRMWTVTGDPKPTVAAGLATAEDVPVVALSPGAVEAVHPRMRVGRTYSGFHEDRAERVAILGSSAALRLGVSRLDAQPAVFIGGTAFTVIGIVEDVERRTDLLFAVMIPTRTATVYFGPPSGGTRASMIVDTRLGAARLVADQVALALRPDDPELFKVTPPPDPRSLREGVAGDLNVLFVVLAALCLLVGAFGIANTTLVSVLERVPEIGLRRALGARRHHITLQFLTESALLGTLGGLVGTAAGTTVVVAVSVVQDWTPILASWTVLCGPLVGLLVGLAAGAYPAVRAAAVEPVDALRRG